MPRAKGGPKTRRRHKRQLKLASGFVGGRKLYRQARNTLEKGLTYAYRDRKQKKRAFRSLWITRINALVREHGLSYSRFIRRTQEGRNRTRPQAIGGARARIATSCLASWCAPPRTRWALKPLRPRPRTAPRTEDHVATPHGLLFVGERDSSRHV